MPKKAQITVVEHPRFDRKRFRVTIDLAKDRGSAAYNVFTNQAQTLLDLMGELVVSRREKDRVVSGEQLREHLESHRSRLGDTRQSEVFRVFQDYRARFERAGFIQQIKAGA